MLMKIPEKVSELLELMADNTCLPHNYPMHQGVCLEKEEKLIKPSVFHALDLVEKMLRNNLDPKGVLKIFKLVICTHEHEQVQTYLCNAIREEIIFKYIS